MFGQRGGCARLRSRFHVLDRHTLARFVLRTRFGDALLESRVVLEAVLEPVFLRLEAEQHAGGLAVAGGFRLGQAVLGRWCGPHAGL